MCDLAEFYGITDMEALPVTTLAGLSCGLPIESRTMLRMSGLKLPINTLLLATIADRLGVLAWQNTEDARKGQGRPPSILSELLGENKENNNLKFKTGADFDSAWEKILGKEDTNE